jgi:hypothetical protein
VRIIPVYFGERPAWTVGPPRGAWLEAGKPLKLDWSLAAFSEIVIDPSTVGLKPFEPLYTQDSTPLWLSNPRERWIVGVKPGALDAAGLSRLLFSEDAAFAFIQDSRGQWLPRIGARGLSMMAYPGVYDVYLIETTDIYREPSVRVLAARKSVRVKDGKNIVDFRPEHWRKPGKAEIAGVLKGRSAVKRGALMKADSVARLHSMLAPSIRLYDEAGRFAAAAFAAVSYNDFGHWIGAIERGSEREIADGADFENAAYRITGLAAGKYRMELSVPGRPVVKRSVVLAEDKSVRFDADGK